MVKLLVKIDQGGNKTKKKLNWVKKFRYVDSQVFQYVVFVRINSQ